MPIFNFTRLATLYLADGSNIYDIPIYNGMTISQTYSETQVKAKTLHRREDLDGRATITKVAPANFSFTTPATNQLLLSRLLSLSAPIKEDILANFTLYLSFEGIYYMLETSVIENITFNIEKHNIVTLTVSGTASKLTTRDYAFGITANILKGSQYITAMYIKAEIDSNVLVGLSSIHVDIANSIQWRTTASVHNATNSTIAYPDIYTCSNRRTSGSITQYLTEITNSTIPDYSIGSNITISIYNNALDNSPALIFTLPKAVYTRRSDLGSDALLKVIDFKSLT